MFFNRRKFLKSTIAAGAFLATGVKLNFKAWASEQEKAPVELKYSYCNTCSSHCGLWIHVKNGRAWKVTGNEDHARSRGKLCARAHAGLAWIYDPGRVKTPLKRVGENQFQEISWEQAATEIGDKVQGIIAEHGPQGIVWKHNPRETGVFYGRRFLHALGSNTIMTHNAACNTTLAVGFGETIGRTPGADRNRTDYMMCIGRNYGEGIRTNEATQFMGALARGAKVVCVDPRLSATGALATEWVPIRPGTDLAFVLAMCNVLIKEDLYDKEFIANHTEGFEEFLAVIDEYTPEWAAAITDIDAETIKRLARELAAHAPKALVDPSWKGAFGTNYKNSTETARAVAYINALLGNIGQPGGLSLGASLETGLGNLDSERYPAPAAPTLPRIDGAGITGEYPLSRAQGLPHYVAEKAKQGLIKAWFIRHSNPVRNFPDYEHMRQGLLNSDLVVTIETHMTESALVSDYILPEPSYAEREEVIEQIGNSVSMRTVAVPKVHPETKSLDEIITLLAEKCGVGEYFNFTLDELNNARLAPLGLTTDELRQKGCVNQQTKPNELDTFKFFNQKFVDAGFSGVVQWIEPAVGTRVGADEFFILNGKQGYHSHTATANIPQLAQITKDYNSQRVWINATKAAALGIKDGDWINISSNNEAGRVQVKVTERIHPDAMFIPGGYGNKTPYYELSKQLGGVNPNDLVKYQLEPHIGHAMLQESIVKVSLA
ncbi:molybdopterin-containing oxidoreductase family protein [Desulfuribacillus alkaliarsenatis]|uniref:4Fe-4S Mo/W bis-MGD-type domain-containing protein n=1 Tax=Desulfuribacillus alkaliarsenatis TaxID=766136 RepID=A0A1E5G3L3_9FIRM|nr:molybdopterin-dependent oxidoreductase [Desulfuribacillus alkaliarsenatis]OEF97677.1 hypothetical protein BHF68_14340 [Desulfuribacillus alkaliarsenatis]